MANLTQKYIDIVKDRYPNEPEFIQTVEEVLTSIEPVVEAHPEYVESGLMDRIIEPERMIQFRVPWMDDEKGTANGKCHLRFLFWLFVKNGVNQVYNRDANNIHNLELFFCIQKTKITNNKHWMH